MSCDCKKKKLGCKVLDKCDCKSTKSSSSLSQALEQHRPAERIITREITMLAEKCAPDCHCGCEGDSDA